MAMRLSKALGCSPESWLGMQCHHDLWHASKHGMDFGEAQALWGDSDLIEIPARTVDEPQFLVIGRIDGRHWSAVVTRRGGSIRLISVRRSRPEEVALYEG